MLNQLFFITTLSLFDSFSTTTQIVIFILILTTANPLKNSMAFLSGLLTAYFACGIIGFMAIDELKAFVARFFTNPMHVTDAVYYRTQLLTGVVFAAIGVINYLMKKNSVKPPAESALINRLSNMTVYTAFGIGAFISVSGFPMSLPYIAALAKFSALQMTMTEVVSCLILYNAIYSLPMVVIFYVYLASLGKTENLEATMHEKARVLNLKLTSAMFLGLGLLSVADALFFFFSGHPMLKNRYF